MLSVDAVADCLLLKKRRLCGAAATLYRQYDAQYNLTL